MDGCMYVCNAIAYDSKARHFGMYGIFELRAANGLPTIVG